MAHFLLSRVAASYTTMATGETVTLELWGGTSGGNPLVVAAANGDIVSVSEQLISTRPEIRTFSVRGLKKGTTVITARLGERGPAWCSIRVVVGDPQTKFLFYHGTSRENAEKLMDSTIPVYGGQIASAMDWTDFTDFGKGFYVHKEENRKLAFDWAKRNNTEWGVVEFCLLGDEIDAIRSKILHFSNKTHRPGNSPKIPVEVADVLLGQFTSPDHASWLEFVEYNRHIIRSSGLLLETKVLIARPNDRDWSAQFSAILGPIWVPRDSGFDTGSPKFPDSLHQVNWGKAGLDQLNAPAAVKRRFLYHNGNAGLFAGVTGGPR